jgi:MtN3 and saliva related transmembrane protein
MWLMLCAGISLWIVYGLYTRSIPVIAANAVTLVLAGTVLGFKLRYR